MYLRIHMLMHYFTFGFKWALVNLQHSFEIHCLVGETDNQINIVLLIICLSNVNFLGKWYI